MGEVTHYHVVFLYQDKVMADVLQPILNKDDAATFAEAKVRQIAAEWNVFHPEGDPLRATVEQTQKPGRGKTKDGIPGVPLYEWSATVNGKTLTGRVVPCDEELEFIEGGESPSQEISTAPIPRAWNEDFPA